MGLLSLRDHDEKGNEDLMPKSTADFIVVSSAFSAAPLSAYASCSGYILEE
jgi:hypothetical protein